MYYTYVLKCTDTETNKTIFYVGSTEDLRKRLRLHKAGNTKTTKIYSEKELVYYEACLNKSDSIKREHQLKTGFGRGYLKKRIDSYLNSRV